MKRISNLEEYRFAVDMRDGDGNMVRRPVTASDAELFKTPLNSVVIGGREPITREALKQIDRICDILDEAQRGKKKALILEESDYRFLYGKFNQYGGWSPGDQIRKCILKAGDKLEKAEDYDPNKDKAAAEKGAPEKPEELGGKKKKKGADDAKK